MIVWWTVSKAAVRSNRTSAAILPWSTAVKMFERTSKMAV